jgi:hypothetical protein
MPVAFLLGPLNHLMPIAELDQQPSKLLDHTQKLIDFQTMKKPALLRKLWQFMQKIAEKNTDLPSNQSNLGYWRLRVIGVIQYRGTNGCQNHKYCSQVLKNVD